MTKFNPPKPRNMVAWGMIVTSKSVKMRDRRNRRPKDTKRSWRNEEH